MSLVKAVAMFRQPTRHISLIRRRFLEARGDVKTVMDASLPPDSEPVCEERKHCKRVMIKLCELDSMLVAPGADWRKRTRPLVRATLAAPPRQRY
jgi:hypothetical protein